MNGLTCVEGESKDYSSTYRVITVYAPKDEKPWAELFPTDSFQIFIIDENELNQLWSNFDSWVKKDWHDLVMKSKKSAHLANKLFKVTLIHGLSSDLSWKLSQYKSKQNKIEKVTSVGIFDAFEQKELKTIINSLVKIEGHPGIGLEVAKMLADVKPLLAKSMDGKQSLQLMREEVHKASKLLNESCKSVYLKLLDCHSKPPI